MPRDGRKSPCTDCCRTAMGSRPMALVALDFAGAGCWCWVLATASAQLLRYDRSAIAAGGWWRLLTAHIVHLDAHHLMLNELGLVLMWSLFAQDYDAVEWCAIVFAGALAISSGLWWLSPRVAWYVGASGVLHSVMAAGTAKHLAERAWDRWILLVVLVRQAGLRAAGRARGAAGRGRCPSVRRVARIRGGGCTLLADRYNSPPLQRLEADQHVTRVRLSRPRVAVRRHDECACESSPR